MVSTTATSNVHPANDNLIQRDYWQIELLPEELTDLAAEACVAIVRGRRRTSEAFWPGLRLCRSSFLRFATSIQNAVTVAKGFNAEDDGSCQAVFPNSHTLAICNGTEYLLETSETVDGYGNRSIATTIFGMGPPMRPSAHLIDEELMQFCSDLESIAFRIDLIGADSQPLIDPQTGIL